MGDKSLIQWTDSTWNPVTGCTKVSAGCLHCYAEGVDKRFHETREGEPFAPWTVKAEREAGHSAVRLHPDRLAQPLHWKRPRRIFVNSMSDLFHEDVPDEFIGRVFMSMALEERHTFQVLTKRPQRALEWFKWAASHSNDGLTVGAPTLPRWSMNHGAWPLPNVWLGVSVENQRAADERLPVLAEIPAAVRFVSAEPLLGPLDLGKWLSPSGVMVSGASQATHSDRFYEALAEVGRAAFRKQWGLSWVIVGGESGPKARPFDLTWARDIVEQCKAAQVACFVKQLGSYAIETAASEHVRVIHDFITRDRKGGDWDEWPDDLRVREFPAVAVATL